MKLDNELELVVSKLELIKDKIPTYVIELKKENNFKNLENRLAWDCLRAVMGTTYICSLYDKYNANDTHIETLAKKALKQVYTIE